MIKMKRQTNGILTDEYIKMRKQKLIILSFKGKIKEREKQVDELEKTDVFRVWRKEKKMIKTLEKYIRNAHEKILELIQ